jgi:hypothetical protein
MKAIEEDLIYFLKHGEMENFPLGINRQTMFEILGEPEWDNCREEFCHILGYGNFEFYFMEPGEAEWLSSIKKSSFQDKYRGKQLDFEPYNWSSKLTIEEASAFLRLNEIAFRMVEVRFEEERELFTESGVRLVFSSENYDPEGPFFLVSFYSRNMAEHPGK